MKQKRKVKSLISLKDESNVLLTALLFLLGGILCFGAVTLFTSSVGVEAAGGGVESYTGIDDKHEVLLELGLIERGGATPLNQMYLTGNTFFMSGDKGVSLDDTAYIRSDKYINYLGGKSAEGINIASNNITIIGGEDSKVMEDNDNAAILGGIDSMVDKGKTVATAVAAPALLGGENNRIGEGQEGSAIVGGKDNTIGSGVSYGFIVGGESNKIDNESKNVIVGGQRVKVEGKASDLFAFSDGHSLDFNPQGGNAFYLNVENGLGLNEGAERGRVDSNGAVSFGKVDINTQICSDTDLGVEGTWEGCLVGCTDTSSALGKWEMIDHGEDCENLCKGNNSKCMINPVEPDKPNPYTGYCTTDGVDISNSHHCGGEENILPTYKNVLFETTLIDSNDKCPQPGTPNWTENRCVFKCDGGFHLTGDKTGGDGRTRCYKDCRLPWDGTLIKHNQTVTGYNTDETYCAFPSGSPASPHTCADHKKTLVCQNGTLYVVKNGTIKADLTMPAIEKGYVYSGCMLNQYRCNTGVYNYTASDITDTSKFKDTVNTWNLTDRNITNGRRGQYRLCIDYNTTPNAVQQINGETCVDLNKTTTNPVHYTTHYQWVGCQNGYHTGQGYENVCMADCTLDGKTIRHNQTMPAYKVKKPTCPNVCEEATFTCNDGKLVGSNGATTGTYKYSSCQPQAVTCNGYGISQATYDAHHVETKYLSCQKYSVNSNNIFSCTTGNKVYKINGCISNYHTENGNSINNQYCVKNSKEVNCRQAGSTATAGTFHYNVIPVTINWKSSCGWKGTTSSCWETAAACSWDCNSGYHKVDGDCVSNSNTAQCNTVNVNPPKDEHADFIIVDVPITYTEGVGWSDPEDCARKCWSGWTRVGNECVKDPDPENGVCGSGAYTCEHGTLTGEDTTSTNYVWICAGIAGGNDSPVCTAPRPINFDCDDTHYECINAISTDHDDSDSEKWTWKCITTDGQEKSCSETKTGPDPVTVKFIVNNYKTTPIFVREVEIGEDGHKDWTSYGCFPDDNEEVGDNGGSITCTCQGTFIAGEDYYPQLVYDDNISGNPDGFLQHDRIVPSVGENVYTFNVVDSNPVQIGICGDAKDTPSLQKPTLNLCSVGEASTPVEDVRDGMSRTPIWKWTCTAADGYADCFTYIPTATIDAEDCGNSYSIDFGTNPYSLHGFDGVEMEVDIKYMCRGADLNYLGQVYNKTVALQYYGNNGGIWQNPSGVLGECAYDTDYNILSAVIKSVSPSEYNGYRLFPGRACGSELPDPECGYANGKTYTSEPASNLLCDKGVAGPVQEDDSMGIYYWYCNVGVENKYCEATKKVNGVCKNGTQDACEAGTSTGNVTLSDRYEWICAGINGGSNSPTCTAPRKRNGQCDDTHYNCIVGTSGNQVGADGATGWTWTCGGVNGGFGVNCNEPCPNGKVLQGGVCVTPQPSQFKCNGGSYLPKNSTTCSPCPCGYYCPGGEWPKSTTGDQGINTCASNTYSSTGSSICSSCSSGYHPNSTQCSCDKDLQCHYNGGTYNPGDHVNVWPSSRTCPEICTKVSATCRPDGTWDKDMNNSTCQQNAGSLCSSDYTLSSEPTNASYTECTEYTAESHSYTDPYNGFQTYYSCTPQTKYKITSCNGGKMLNLAGTACIDPYIMVSATISYTCSFGGGGYYADNIKFLAGTTYYSPVAGPDHLQGCSVVGCGWEESKTCYFEVSQDALGTTGHLLYDEMGEYGYHGQGGWAIRVGY